MERQKRAKDESFLAQKWTEVLAWCLNYSPTRLKTRQKLEFFLRESKKKKFNSKKWRERESERRTISYRESEIERESGLSS